MPNKMESSLFGLSYEQYWNEPLWQEPASDFASNLLGTDADGMFIDVPSSVYLDQHQSVPLAAMRSGSKAKLRKFSFESTAKLIVVHLESGKIQMVQAAASPAVKNPPASPGWTVRNLVIDLATVVDLEPKLGEYLTWMICGPEISNQRLFQLFPNREAEQSPDLISRLEKLRKEGGSPQPLFQGKNWGVIHQAPKPMDGAIPYWNLTKRQSGNSPYQIDLEYRIEGLPRFLFQKDQPHLDKSRKQIYANLPILIVGFDENRSLVIKQDIGLPVMNAPEGNLENPILSGHATFDVGPLLEGQKPVKALTLWAITMDQRSMVDLEIGTGKVE